MAETSRELPRYRSHKEVWALKIASIKAIDEKPNDEGAMIVPTDDGYAPIHVTSAYMRKHEPKEGGYWVRYPDGYESWSPAESFDGGYTRVN